MRALVISDTHFGAWTGDDLLRRKAALDLLAPHLDDVDEVILLGDLFDFLFSTVEEAFRAAEGFFTLLSEKMVRKRVVFLAGNHDHHIMLRELEQLVELELASGHSADAVGSGLRHSNYFARFLRRRLPETDAEIVYPTYRFGDALLFHGHYLDAHMEGSIANRLLRRATWQIAGGPQSQPAIADYESLITPLTELLYSVAQLPRGATTQQAVYGHLENIERWMRLASAPGRELGRVFRRITDEVRGLASARSRQALAELTEQARATWPARGARRGPHESAGLEIARVVRPSEPAAAGLEAYAQVVRNLGWDSDCDTMIFAHTHQPLSGVRAAENDSVRYWNTGSWIYQPTLGSVDDYLHYLEYAWPGTAVVIDTDRPEPELVPVLARHNPLYGIHPSAPEQRILYQRARRSGMQVPGPLGPQPQPSEAPAPAARRAVISMVRRRRLRGIAVFAVGATAAVNLVGALFPAITRVHALALLLPLGVAEGTRALLFVVAALLLVITRGLWQGNRRAWATALLLVSISAALHLVRHGELVGTGVSVAAVALVAATASSFRVPARTLPPGLPLLAILTVFAAVLAYGLVGWEAVAAHLPPTSLSGRVGATFRAAFLFDPGIRARDSLGSGFLDSLGLIGGVSLFALLSLALGSFAVSPRRPNRHDLHSFLVRFGQTSTAPLVGAPDNQTLELVEGRALVGFKVVSGVAVVVGEPVGEPGTQLQALEEFVERCEVYGWTPALCGVSQDTADRAGKLGFEALKISEEAVVDLSDFSIGGPRRAKVRHAISRARREGVEVFAYRDTQRTLARDEELAALSRRWLKLKQGPEMGFTLGRFDPLELSYADPYIAVAGDRVVGFVTWLSYCDGFASVIDLMRRLPDSPPGTMELLIYHCLTEFRDRGRHLASLGGVALASTTERIGLVERSLGWLFDYGGQLYEAKGLFSFKQKFDPSWKPQYLLYPTTLDLPRIMFAVRRAYRNYRPAAPDDDRAPVAAQIQSS